MPSKNAFLKHCWGNQTCDWNTLGNSLNGLIKSSCYLIEVEDQEGSCFVPLHESFEVAITYTCRQIFYKDHML